MGVGAVITAAGMSSRMLAFKPMLEIDGVSSVRRIIRTLREGGADCIVLITGKNADILEAHVSDLGVICLRNEKFATSQMFDSVKIGLNYISDKYEKILFTPSDIPLFSSETVRELLNTEAQIAVPQYCGIEGHPILLSSEAVKKLLIYSGEGGLAGAVENCGLEKKLVEVWDEGILFDMDTPKDYEKLISIQSGKNNI